MDMIAAISNRAALFLNAQSHSIVFSAVVLTIAIIGLMCFKTCNANGRLAMREIYLTDVTSEQVMEIKILVAVSLFALSTFLLRF